MWHRSLKVWEQPIYFFKILSTSRLWMCAVAVHFKGFSSHLASTVSVSVRHLLEVSALNVSCPVDAESDGFSRRWGRMHAAGCYWTGGIYSCYCSLVQDLMKSADVSLLKKQVHLGANRNLLPLNLLHFVSFCFMVAQGFVLLPGSTGESVFYYRQLHFVMCNSFCWLH